ncbi:hypothetical protein Taro_006605 [Colocasia esculenta]|uniref:MAR-binding filament-like protein 1-1 n=1 Tax=Colocasia esculenta TaxID=4460 RepID=A0A843U184_COLES|nr:hypothetical protein [Colocasia esculenta]
MGYAVLGSSSSLQPPLFQALRPFPSSSSSSPCCCPAVVSSSHRKVARRKPSAMASLRPEDAKESGNTTRRALLLVGFSAMPFLQLRAASAAVEAPEKDKQDTKMAEAQAPGSKMQDSSSYTQQNENEHAGVQQAPGNPFVSLLNELAIIGSGVLGALYAISQREKADMEITIESMKTTLTEKEATTVLLKKESERKLLEQQEEHQKQIRNLKEDEVLLSSQLSSERGKVTALGKELQNEKRSVEELKLQAGRLCSTLTQAREDKHALETKLREKLDTIDALQDRASLLSIEIKDKEKNIDALASTLTEKESECKNLRSAVEQTKVDLEEANSALAHLKTKHLKTKEELDLNNSSINDLKMKMSSLLAERDDIDVKLHALQGDYNDMKSDFVKKAASHSELLTKKDEEIHQLEEKLGLALTEAKSKQVLITDITNERDSFRVMLEEERAYVKTLRDELQITQETLRDSKLQASDLLKQLQESSKINDELVAEVSRIGAESSEAQRLLNSSLDKARSTSKQLSDELSFVKDALEGTREELAAASDELKVTSEAHDSLKKELLEVYKKAEAVENELKQERQTVTSLNRELEASEKLIEKYSEARKEVERDLDEATKALDEMTKKALSLSKELEGANSRNATLETEKGRLYESLLEQKKVSKEAQENIEDAQNVITRLGSERGRLEKKVKKFEEEIAAAKGEILRLRRQIALSKGSAGEQHKNANDVESAALVVPKRSGGRRRRSGPASQVSQQET